MSTKMAANQPWHFNSRRKLYKSARHPAKCLPGQHTQDMGTTTHREQQDMGALGQEPWNFPACLSALFSGIIGVDFRPPRRQLSFTHQGAVLHHTDLVTALPPTWLRKFCLVSHWRFPAYCGFFPVPSSRPWAETLGFGFLNPQFSCVMLLLLLG